MGTRALASVGTVDLAGFLSDPARAAEIPVEDVPALLGELERLKATLLARLMTPERNGNGEAPDPDRLLTVPEVAQLLSVPKGYVYELARRGDLPTVRIGKYVRVSASALREWEVRRQQKVEYHARQKRGR